MDSQTAAVANTQSIIKTEQGNITDYRNVLRLINKFNYISLVDFLFLELDNWFNEPKPSSFGCLVQDLTHKRKYIYCAGKDSGAMFPSKAEKILELYPEIDSSSTPKLMESVGDTELGDYKKPTLSTRNDHRVMISLTHRRETGEKLHLLLFWENLTKEQTESIKAMITTVHYIFLFLAQRYFQIEVRSQPGDRKILTKREIEILRKLSAGYSSKEISDSMNISYHTVCSHSRNIYKKLQVNNRQKALQKASRLGVC